MAEAAVQELHVAAAIGEPLTDAVRAALPAALQASETLKEVRAVLSEFAAIPEPNRYIAVSHALDALLEDK